MWNAYFASRAALAGDGPSNANGVTSDFAIAEYQAARDALQARVAAGEFGTHELAATILKRGDNVIVTIVTPTIATEVQGEPEPV